MASARPWVQSGWSGNYQQVFQGNIMAVRILYAIVPKESIWKIAPHPSIYSQVSILLIFIFLICFSFLNIQPCDILITFLYSQ